MTDKEAIRAEFKEAYGREFGWLPSDFDIDRNALIGPYWRLFLAGRSSLADAGQVRKVFTELLNLDIDQREYTWHDIQWAIGEVEKALSTTQPKYTPCPPVAAQSDETARLQQQLDYWRDLARDMLLAPQPTPPAQPVIGELFAGGDGRDVFLNHPDGHYPVAQFNTEAEALQFIESCRQPAEEIRDAALENYLEQQPFAWTQAAKKARAQSTPTAPHSEKSWQQGYTSGYNDGVQDGRRTERESTPTAPQDTPTGCDYCNNPLFCGTSCDVCGKRFEEPPAQGEVAELRRNAPQPCSHKNSHCVYESDDGEFERWECKDCGYRWGVEIPQ